MSKINYAGPHILDSDAEFVYNAVLNGFYENYKLFPQLLESKLGEITNSKYVIATNSCTAAIHLSLLSLGITEGDEVITTDSSCVASAMPILYCGATPVFADVDPTTWCLDPESVRGLITKKTKAILVVHWNGHPADMETLRQLASDHGLRIIEDSAAALGSTVGGSHVGALGDLGCFSFQGAKIAIGGQGGALITNNSDLYERARVLASYGRTDSVMPYWSDYLGYNYGIASLAAALVCSQLERLDMLLAIKKRIFDQYRRGLDSSNVFVLIEPAKGTTSNYCYPPLLMDPSSGLDRDALINFLQSHGVDARNAQPRLSKMPMFDSRVQTPNSKIVEQYGVILPSAFNLSTDDVDFVIDRLFDFAQTHTRQ
jgi:perosamine synthetase